MKEDVGTTETSSMILPVLISGAVGAGLALLLTPKSGRDLRQDIKRYASSSAENVSETTSDIMEKGRDLYGQGKEAAGQALGSSAQSYATEGREALEEEESGAGARSLILPVLVSGVVGAAVALLFAPKPGSELMEDIKDYASTAWDKGRDLYEQGAAAVKDAMEKGKETAAETSEKLRPAA